MANVLCKHSWISQHKIADPTKILVVKLSCIDPNNREIDLSRGRLEKYFIAEIELDLKVYSRYSHLSISSVVHLCSSLI